MKLKQLCKRQWNIHSADTRLSKKCKSVQKVLTGFFPNVALGGFRLGKRVQATSNRSTAVHWESIFERMVWHPLKYRCMLIKLPWSRLNDGVQPVTGKIGKSHRKAKRMKKKKKGKVLMHPKMPLAVCETYPSYQKRKYPRELSMAPVVLLPCTKGKGYIRTVRAVLQGDFGGQTRSWKSLITRSHKASKHINALRCMRNARFFSCYCGTNGLLPG